MLTDRQRITEKRARVAELRTKIGNVWWDTKAYPHQIPPEGDWFFWLCEEGRGAGKSAGAARYVAKHLNGPPCFSSEHDGDDVPHRVALIAPTLGDAIESAVTDDDALVRLHPGATFSAGLGGSTVKWPNGSQVRLFGTLNREDIERLRAGGNRSLAVGTLIETWNGQRPIETIIPGELVYTAGGLRPVVGSWNHGYRPLWQIETELGRTLMLTPDHEVWTLDGWIRCDSLTVGSTIAVWNGMVTAGRNSATDTGHEQSDATADRRHCSCTVPCGRDITARSLPVSTSITSTVTRPTTTSRTYPLLTLPNTTHSIPKSSHRSGTLLVDAMPNATRSLSKTVNSAGRSSRAIAKLGSVARNAGDGFNPITPQPSVCDHASCAVHLSTVLPGPPPSLVPDRVATILRGSVEGPVWDLTVAGEHAFVADGIYVSNCLVWAEELATWRQLDDAWKHMMLGLRIGPQPRVIATTTPKPRPEYVKVRLQADHISHATTDDNPNLNPEHRKRLYDLYEGTSIGEQELKGKLIEEADGAIWTMALVTAAQNYDLLKPDDDTDDVVDGHDIGHLGRVVVAVDPPGGATEAGIVIAGVLRDCPCKGPRLPHFAVLEDVSGKLTPNRWGGRAVDSHYKWSGDRIVGESNFGGDLIEATIRNIDPSVPYKNVRATRGKKIRAEPILALYEQGRVHHVTALGALEGEMVQWVPGESEWSPNRIDSMVWAISELSTRKEWVVG